MSREAIRRRATCLGPGQCGLLSFNCKKKFFFYYSFKTYSNFKQKGKMVYLTIGYVLKDNYDFTDGFGTNKENNVDKLHILSTIQTCS